MANSWNLGGPIDYWEWRIGYTHMESMETAPRRVGLLNTSTVNIEMDASVEIDLLLSTRNVTQAYV